MAIQRQFLGWDGPGVQLAAQWLWDHYAPTAGDGGGWDLSQVVVVLPGGRAVRRMGEVLVALAGERGVLLWPPRMVTTGGLAELLYESDGEVADDLAVALAWWAALRDSEPAVLAAIAPLPPEEGDALGWLGVAQELAAMRSELAGAMLTPADVLPRLERIADFPDERRWSALASVFERYERVMAQRGLVDRDAARLAALAQGRCACAGQVVLVGCVDLPGVATAMLLQLSDATPITALVCAPESESEAFDEAGGLRVEAWRGRHVGLADEEIRVVDAPRDQAHEVVRVLETLGPAYAADQITVGLGDESQAGLIQRTLQLAGLPARSALGRPVAESAPLRLLAALGRFVGSRRFDDLAALLRHPDVEACVDRTQDVAAWLTLLDRYANDHLQRRVSDTWLGDERTRARLGQVYAAVTALLPVDAQERRPLPQWAQPIADALAKVYAHRTLSRHDEHDRRVIGSLTAAADVLRQWRATGEGGESHALQLTASEAIRLLATQLADRALPEPGGEAAIELLGWLELALDDAPLLIVTGVNEGHVPASRGPDAWLPDSARAALGLADDRRRLARDTLLLTMMRRSRPHLRLIACRRGVEGDPVPPSRLLLACDAATQARRLLRFYDEQPAIEAPLLLLAPGAGGFVIPRPPLPGTDAPPIDRLSVTAFADYIACPYRFYLKHVLGLGAMDDRAIEMGGDAFGELAHAVLDDFGRDGAAALADERAVAAALDHLLDERVRRRFGESPAAAVMLQCRLMRRRLGALARWQARQVADGWRVVHAERKIELPIPIDGATFTLTGKIDRIDRRDADGRHRILDYKTSDKARTPEEVHRSGTKELREWVSLQLPLYRKLARKLGVGGEVELGYVLLPRELHKVGLAPATWDEEELRDAEERAMQIIRAIRRGEFWPPRDPLYADDYSGICMDDTIDGAEFRRRLKGGAP